MTTKRPPKTPLKDVTFGDVQRVAQAMKRDDPDAAAQFDRWCEELMQEPEVRQALAENEAAFRAAEAADPLGFWEHRLAYRMRTLAELRAKDAPAAILRHQKALIERAQAYVGYHRLRVANERYQADPSPAHEAALGVVLGSPEFAATLAHFHGEERRGRPGRPN